MSEVEAPSHGEEGPRGESHHRDPVGLRGPSLLQAVARSPRHHKRWAATHVSTVNSAILYPQIG